MPRMRYEPRLVATTWILKKMWAQKGARAIWVYMQLWACESLPAPSQRFEVGEYACSGAQHLSEYAKDGVSSPGRSIRALMHAPAGGAELQNPDA